MIKRRKPPCNDTSFKVKAVTPFVLTLASPGVVTVGTFTRVHIDIPDDDPLVRPEMRARTRNLPFVRSMWDQKREYPTTLG